MKLPVRFALAPVLMLTLTDAALAADPPYEQTKNLVYAEDHGVGLVLDVFTPTGDANGLGLVDVASGSYYSDRGKIEDHRRARVYDIFCSKGYCVFAVRPGSITKFGVGEMAGNVKKGVAWVKDHADEFNVDPERLGIMGASAGGNLAALHAVTADDTTEVKAAGVFFPPTDFTDFRDKISAETDLANVDDRIKRFVYGASGGSPASASELLEKLTAISPALLVTEKAPPFLIIHGDADPIVPLEQSKKLLAALEAESVPAELIIKKGGGHPGLTIPEEVKVMADWFDKRLADK